MWLISVIALWLVKPLRYSKFPLPENAMTKRDKEPNLFIFLLISVTNAS